MTPPAEVRRAAVLLDLRASFQLGKIDRAKAAFSRHDVRAFRLEYVRRLWKVFVARLRLADALVIEVDF